MASLNCFCSSWRKKKDKEKEVNTLHVKLEHLNKTSESSELKSASFSVPVPLHIPRSSRCTVKVMNHESPVGGDGEEIDYEGGDEHDENLSMKRDNSDFDLQAHVENSNEEKYQTFEGMTINHEYPKEVDEDSKAGIEVIRSGHVSDPGIGKTEFWASPMLKRSCSDMLIRNVNYVLDEQVPLSKSKSFEEILSLAERFQDEILDYPPTPVSVMTQHSADKVMLKKHSSSQILPSRSRKLWWKLFLWSHRNLHRNRTTKPRPVAVKPTLNQQGGYCSDTIEPRKAEKFSKENKGKDILNIDNQSWDGFYGVSGMWPQNQWVAFPTESSPFERIDKWVKEVSVQPPFEVNKGDHTEDSIFFPPSPENNRSPATRSPAAMIPEEITYANSVVQSLNSSSTVAHITGIGLKVIPSVSHFSILRSVNLSSNSIGHITPGSLPKGLHILKLSKNNISTIEGLRELTRLRVLDLSYNRISRIGQGLSNCMLIKELYLAGNKISNVEGLHRLLKLTVLDLSFNKITTTKAFGQLLANSNSLVALNLLGNPVHNNIGDDQLRKTICSLLPKLVFLNKQTINPHKLREVGSEAIAKAALGNSIRSTRGKAVKRVSQGGSSSSTLRRSSATATATRQSRHGAKSRSNHHTSLTEKSFAFSSR
ncbi:Leucine-rich repeat, typical subtype [Olea europaea subsp. europaea]|uniref:Leucine-rich repeat, typical subtype n=1 Tax=Olea europaea subsp. europaea TaxID=158383 RepID=A0A8S0TER5_OLEEU|nr:Leucine-rich repeat, typical subtype [Olea europaea subsp. europaea]